MNQATARATEPSAGQRWSASPGSILTISGVNPRMDAALAERVRTKGERLREVFRRIVLAPACYSADNAFDVIRETLNRVEDELSSIPYDPCHPRGDGRLYPAKPGSRCRAPGRPDLRRYRFKRHWLYIGANGAILVEHRESGVVFSKPGFDGQPVDLVARAA
jgi:hypothetical protein